MSIFGATNSAISGLTSQWDAFGNISENVANSQTVVFKRVDMVNYNNGQTRTIAQVPQVTFNAPDSLQGQNGQSFTATTTSGNPLADAVNTNGAGSLVVSLVEDSNVDIATEFSQLIIAQQSGSANAKVVTTPNDMLNSTINMKQ
jgi:flagellar hook protein FlgE